MIDDRVTLSDIALALYELSLQREKLKKERKLIDRKIAALDTSIDVMSELCKEMKR